MSGIVGWYVGLVLFSLLIMFFRLSAEKLFKDPDEWRGLSVAFVAVFCIWASILCSFIINENDHHTDQIRELEKEEYVYRYKLEERDKYVKEYSTEVDKLRDENKVLKRKLKDIKEAIK